MYTLIVQCPLLNCGIPVKVAAVVMVCSLSSFPRPQPQCSPYKNSPRVCAYEEDCAACAVYVHAKDCVCVQWRRWRASSSTSSSTCRPNSTCRHCTIRWWGWGLCPAQDLLQDQTRAKQGHKKKWLFLQRFFAKSRPGFWLYCVVLSTCCVTRTAINIS